MMDIRELALQRNLKLEWVRRSGNKVAHHVAKFASKGILNLGWVANPPVCLLSFLCSDVSLSEL